MSDLLSEECPQCHNSMTLGEYGNDFKWDCNHCKITYFPAKDQWCDYDGIVLIPIQIKEQER